MSFRNTSMSKGGQHREKPIRCPHTRCPGCPLLYLAYEEQLEVKRQRVVKAFEVHLGGGVVTLPEILPTRPSPDETGYRATARLVLSRARNDVLLGIYERGTHTVVDVPWCLVHDPVVASGIRALRGLLSKAPLLVSPGVGAQGWLRYAAFQASVHEQKLSVSLVTASDEAIGVLRSLVARLVEQVPEVSGVVWNLNPSSGNEIFGENWEVLWGEGAIREQLGTKIFQASPGSFLQANRAQAGWVYASAADWLQAGPSDVVMDLYSGVGGLALHLAPRVRRTLAVEGSRIAVSDGQWTARSAGVDNVEFYAGRVEEVLPHLLAEASPTLVTLNPPRRGVAPSVIDHLRGTPARAVLYVSCNPETLARDAALLCSDGRFRLTKVLPVDFFPQTEHVETVALFQDSFEQRNGGDV